MQIMSEAKSQSGQRKIKTNKSYEWFLPNSVEYCIRFVSYWNFVNSKRETRKDEIQVTMDTDTSHK